MVIRTLDVADLAVGTRTTIAHETGEYEAALGAAHVDVVRTGQGVGPNRLSSLSFDGVEMLIASINFPVIGCTTLADDIIAVSLIVRSSPGTRWCEIDVEAGDLLLYGASAEHTGLTPVGCEWRSALIEASAIDRMAEELQITIRRPKRGSVTHYTPASPDSGVRSALLSGSAAAGLLTPGQPSSVALVEATARLLADPRPAHGTREARDISSRLVANQAIVYADSVEGMPSLPELCAATHVSERRLRSAFHDTFDMAPSRFMRIRRLSQARRRLLAGDQTVTEIALDLGFDHLGRFAAQYAEACGEHPSTTLATGRAARSYGAPSVG